MKKYLITSSDLYTQDLDTFNQKLRESLKVHMPDFALYRDKTNPDYEKQASLFVEICSGFEGMKSFLHRHVELALRLKASGVHLTSTQLDEIPHAKRAGLEVIISTHTHEEVLKAQKLGADAVAYSPIFVSPNKGKPKGIEDLKALLAKCNIKVFALGGIVEPWHVEAVEEVGVYGFASIRYFSEALRPKPRLQKTIEDYSLRTDHQDS
ncbi:thiamine phosphate synthase [bacterium]|nr:thiamine phosphate synthase [bacterium]MBU1994050.1 thiamine phosphate synthase [bacterium]